MYTLDVKQYYNPPIVEVNKDNGNQNNDLKCEICDFSCKKVNIMKKHMNMKHVNYKCKMCDKEFPNSMDTLAHAAKDHRIFKGLQSQSIECLGILLCCNDPSICKI